MEEHKSKVKIYLTYIAFIIFIYFMYEFSFIGLVEHFDHDEIIINNILIFGAGMVIQSILLAGRSFDINKFFLILLVLGGYNILEESAFSIKYYIFNFYIVYVISFFFVVKKELIPRINNASLLLFNIVFWYALLLNYQIFEKYILFIFIPIILSILVLAVSSLYIKLNNKIKIILYFWFVLMNIIIIISYYSISNYNLFLSTLQQTIDFFRSLSLYAAFFAGMFTLYLSVNILSIIYPLVALMHVTESEENRKDLLDYGNTILSNFSDGQLGTVKSLLVAMFGVIVLFLNYKLNIMSDAILISVIAVIIANMPLTKYLNTYNTKQ